MHAVAIKKLLVEQNPWLPKVIFNAYSVSKTKDYEFMKKLDWAYDSLPWYGQELESTVQLMSKNFWPYGIEANRKASDTICRYSFDQGLSKRRVSLEEMFEKSTLNLEENFVN